jgi:hypothetical protein
MRSQSSPSNNYAVAVHETSSNMVCNAPGFTWNVSVRIPVGVSDIPTKNVCGFLHYFLFAVTITSLNTPLRLPSKLLGQSRNYSRP